jgi:hypothetical protein
MGEEKSGEDVEKKDIGTEGEGSKSSDKKKDGTDGGGSGAGTDKKSDDKSTDKKEDEKKDDEIDLNEEPSTRKKSNASIASHIIARKTAKINKLAEEKKKDEGGGESEEGENEEDGEDIDLDEEVVDPKDKELIGKEVSRHLAPILEKQEQEETKAEVSAFITANPDFKPFEVKILKWSLHPSRKNLPIKAIAYEVAGDKLMKIGAERAKKADTDAKEHESGGGGSGGNGNGSEKGVWDMSVEEFRAKQQEVLRRRQ